MAILDELEKRLTGACHLRFKGGELKYITTLIREAFDSEREKLKEAKLVLLPVQEDVARRIAAVEVVP